MRRFCLTFLLVVTMAPSLMAADVRISNMPDYDWWYGCTPTSFGMILGYYDRGGMSNLIPGGVAPLTTFGQSPSFMEDAIASSGHINDFYNNATGRGSGADYGQINDDGDQGYVRDYSTLETLIYPANPNTYQSPDSFDSIADYLGTSQDIHSPWKEHQNSNGSTSFLNLTGMDNANKWDVEDYINAWDGSKYWGDIALPGVEEWITRQGYSVNTLYHQAIDEQVTGTGFTYADFKNEIDNNRPVLVSIVGHSMVGYGYDDGTGDIFVRDTWASGGAYNSGRMAWNGTYNGAQMQSVVVVELAGAGAPEPGVIILGLLSLLGLLILRRREIRRSHS